MTAIMQLFGQIFLIAIIQTIAEAFIDGGDKPLQIKIINIACFLASLYLVLEFMFSYIFRHITPFFDFIPF